VTVTTEEIWNGFRSKLLGYIRARSRNVQDAEDILQNVFLRVHRGIDGLNDDDRLVSWLFRVTHNSIVDFYRKSVPTPTDREPVEVIDDDLPIAEQSLAPFLRTLAEELPEKYRQAIALSEFDGLTQAEMGRRLGLSASGAKSRVQRGRAMLRAQLETCCHVELDCRGHVVDYESATAQAWDDSCACAAPLQISGFD
jgi:RNA polymerase sigma-70 factor (ECF subfamily)